MVQGSLTSFGDYQYAQEAIRIIREHDTDVPMFFYVAFQCNHLPLEAPDSFIEMCKTPLCSVNKSCGVTLDSAVLVCADPDTWRDDRRWYAAMTSYWDIALGNITDAMKGRGMWNRTLVVFTTDK
jgi:arylsulfatase A-like enzyme